MVLGSSPLYRRISTNVFRMSILHGIVCRTIQARHLGEPARDCLDQGYIHAGTTPMSSRRSCTIIRRFGSCDRSRTTPLMAGSRLDRSSQDQVNAWTTHMACLPGTPPWQRRARNRVFGTASSGPSHSPQSFDAACHGIMLSAGHASRREKWKPPKIGVDAIAPFQANWTILTLVRTTGRWLQANYRKILPMPWRSCGRS